jgi:protein O-GlcNAc transferase
MRSNPQAELNLKAEAQKSGVDADRLVFAKKQPLDRHLARHRLAHLFLDTFNCNAHTTASDALWAGLPLLTLQGQSFASRVASSLLHAVGLPELVVQSISEYERLALALARDPATLQGLKEKLAHNRLTQPLFQSARFARHLESAFQQIHERHAHGWPPRSFSVRALDS